jgi:4-hydroxy-2-oxovalerate aldolase
MAVKRGMSFVRIGTNVNETELAEPFIKRAKELGIDVSCNLMKTYALPLDEVVRRSERLAAWGADVITIVDSAGGMLPADVAAAVRRLCAVVPTRMGFHGHNNAQLAVANALAAIDAGATVIDTTLRGMGRSAGNAQTEVVVALLHRRGMNLGINPFRVMELGERTIAPMARGVGVGPIELTSGTALFHSGFLQPILRVAQRLSLDPKELIAAVSAVEKILVTEALIMKIGRQLASRRPPAPKRESTPRLGPRPWPGGPRSGCRPPRVEGSSRAKSRDDEVEPWACSWGSTIAWRARTADRMTLTQRARAVAAQMHSLAMKSGKRTVFTIAPSLSPTSDTTFPFIRSNSASIIGNADVSSLAEAVEVARAVDGRVDFILVGNDRPWPAGADALAAIRGVVRASELLPYRDTGALVQAVDALVARLLRDRSGHIGVVGSETLGLRIALSLAAQGWQVKLWDEATATMRERVQAVNALLDRGQGSVAPVQRVSPTSEELLL